MDNYVTDYIKKSEENYKLYEFLAQHNKFESWQVVTIFYSALCLAKAYLYSKNIPKNSINSHDCIKGGLAKEKNSRNLNVLYYYENLYRDSRDARYSTKKISKERIKKALENFKEVKQKLIIQ